MLITKYLPRGYLPSEHRSADNRLVVGWSVSMDMSTDICVGRYRNFSSILVRYFTEYWSRDKDRELDESHIAISKMRCSCFGWNWLQNGALNTNTSFQTNSFRARLGAVSLFLENRGGRTQTTRSCCMHSSPWIFKQTKHCSLSIFVRNVSLTQHSIFILLILFIYFHVSFNVLLLRLAVLTAFSESGENPDSSQLTQNAAISKSSRNCYVISRHHFTLCQQSTLINFFLKFVFKRPRSMPVIEKYQQY